MHVKCQCGAEFDLPESYAGQSAECAQCHNALQFTVGALPFEEAGPGDFQARLVIESGMQEQEKGMQFVLGGHLPIEVGKAPTRAIILPGPRVSRQHCRLIRADGGSAAWRVEDSGSTNGTHVNQQRVKSQELRHGDVVQIGNYRLRYLVDDGAAEARPPQSAAWAATAVPVLDLAGEAEEIINLVPEEEPTVASPTPPRPVRAGLTCPSCQRVLPSGAKICVQCGVDAKTGRPLLMSQGLDEDELQEKAEGTIRILSWLIPIGPFYPVASEAYGSKKPYAVWTIAMLTLVASVMFWVAGVTAERRSEELDNLMLWPTHAASDADVNAIVDRVTKVAEQPSRGRKRPVIDDQVRQELVQIFSKFKEVRFRWYQLITHAFLHGDLMHIAGNMLFLLVFGSRVNALIGNIHSAILYPVLAVAAAAAHLLLDNGFSPMLGASGAIMGLAGMYFVFFPVHKVYLVSWIRWGLIGGFHLSFKVYSMRGFWVVLIFIAFDVAATLLHSQDGVAHWAHLGGFAVGMVVAMGLMVARLVDARGGDILSRLLGRYAWALVGKPGARAAE